MTPQVLEAKFPNLVKSMANISKDCLHFVEEALKLDDSGQVTRDGAMFTYLFYRIAALEARMKAHDNGSTFYNQQIIQP